MPTPPKCIYASEVADAVQAEAFLKAIEDGDVQAVLNSKRRKAEQLNISDKFGYSSVHKAVNCSRDKECSMLKYLIDSSAHVEFADRDGARPIAFAIRQANQVAVEALLALQDIRGGRVVDLHQVIDASGHTLLHEAAWYDRTDAARSLLATGAFKPEDLAATNNMGQTVVHVASIRASPEFLQLLVDNGADVNAPCTTNGRFVTQSPDDMARLMGKEENAKLLKSLQTTMDAVKFASKMKKKASAAS